MGDRNSMNKPDIILENLLILNGGERILALEHL